MPTSAETIYTQNRYGVSPETQSVISARNRIYAVPAWGTGSTTKQIGVVATFSPSEGRTVEPVRGIGYGDRVMELVPGMTDPMTMQVTRTAQYLSMIMQVFGYKGGVDGICRSLRHHKYPFDLHQELIIGALAMAAGTGDNTLGVVPAEIPAGATDAGLQAIITIYEACWMSDWSASYASDTALVQEDVTINVTDIIAGYDNRVDDNSDLFAKGAISSFVNAK